ncbi:hypothetical protein [Cystobacter ferrugineus]|nr:hypothetical protein [Cystobacter ferrugineus]
MRRLWLAGGGGLGRVLRGPATRPLKTFATARVSESVWISRAR